jgi:hypothetical protein
LRGACKPIDGTIVIVLHNGEQEIERELTSPADSLCVALTLCHDAGGWKPAT